MLFNALVIMVVELISYELDYNHYYFILLKVFIFLSDSIIIIIYFLINHVEHLNVFLLFCINLQLGNIIIYTLIIQLSLQD